MIKKVISGFLTFGFAFNVCADVNVESIRYEDSAVVGQTTLQLNGAGLRKKVFFKVYAAGLYVPQKAQTAQGVLEIERGQVLAKPGSIKPHTHFNSEVYVLTKEEGGRHTPFFPGYRPQFYFRTTDVTGVITLPEGVEMVMPGDNIQMEIKLITPIAIEEGLRFAIREGGRTVGAGVVASVIE